MAVIPPRQWTDADVFYPWLLPAADTYKEAERTAHLHRIIAAAFEPDHPAHVLYERLCVFFETFTGFPGDEGKISQSVFTRVWPKLFGKEELVDLLARKYANSTRHKIFPPP